jgi:DNA invertase Pin-like site-specific DNA recombinase
MQYIAIKYIRLSNTDSAGESDSITNQSKLIDEFLKNHPEIKVASEKIDDGFSGILFDRPAFNEMMEEIRQGRVNCVITKDLSRFGREYIETGRYLRRIFPAYGVRFIAINDGIDTLNDSADDLSISFRTIINDAYSRDISVKTRSALDIKRVKGDFVGAAAMYGYIKDKNNRNRLVVDEYAASIVKEIFSMKIGGLSAAKIAKTLNERGVLSPLEYKKSKGISHSKGGFINSENAEWSATAIFRILKDETYTGALVQGKTSTPNYKLKQLQQKPRDEWHRVLDTHESIISKYEFNLVQRILLPDTRASPKSGKLNIFSGLLICGHCDNSMTRKTVPQKGNEYSKGNRYFYYFCPKGKKNGCSSPAMIKEQTLLDCIFEILKINLNRRFVVFLLHSIHIHSKTEIEVIFNGTKKQEKP